MRMRRATLAAAFGATLVAGLLAARPADAEDECASDEDCVALYDDGFICASGALGRYCIERGCVSDADCVETYGEGSYCVSWGPEARCEVPDPPRYVPPFRSMCGAAPARPASAWFLLLAPASLLARRRRG